MRENGGRAGLHDAVAFHEGASVHIVGMLRCLFHRKVRGETDVAVLHQLTPLITGTAFEDGGEFGFEFGPHRPTHLLIPLLIGELQLLSQFGVELRLDRADRYVLAVAAFEHVVEVGTGVEQLVRSSFQIPMAWKP